MNGLMSDGGPAFPGTSPSTGVGLTVREYIAAHIAGHMSAIMCMAYVNNEGYQETDAQLIARATLRVADALMAELRN